MNHPEIVLDFDQVNDNFCDCPDGSDEPGTSLCPNGRFYCANLGHIPQYIPSFLVDDGVCDYSLCCDGSDENGTIQCPNRCLELHEKLEAELLEKRKLLKDGLKKKKELENLVVKERDNLQNQLIQLKKELDKKKALLKTLEENYQGDEDQSVILKVSPLLDTISAKVDGQNAKIIDLESKISALEEIMERLSQEYNPNFNDLAVKESIKNFQDYVVNKESVEVSEDDDAMETLRKELALIDVPVIAKEQGILEQIKVKLLEAFNAFTGNPIESIEVINTSPQMESLRREIENITNQIQDIQQELESQNYGPGDILRAYKDRCITKDYGEYSYKYCLTDSITQQGHGSNVLVGKYSRLEVSDGGFKLHFEDGARCWNGPIRNAVIDVECGTEDELINVAEPEVCSYYFKVKSPIACQSLEEEPKISRDEL